MRRRMRPPSPPQQSDESGSTNSRAPRVRDSRKNPLEQATTVLSLIVVMLGLGAALQFPRLRILTELPSYHCRI
jgi:hypothetical protein